jgi:hypothetical protein
MPVYPGALCYHLLSSAVGGELDVGGFQITMDDSFFVRLGGLA